MLTKRLTREQIQTAIKCPNWQTVRLSLKGTATEHKLLTLERYYGGAGCCDVETQRIQVVNYLTALSRGGQIEILPDKFDWNDIKIRR
jgi:hypothetical protein